MVHIYRFTNKDILFESELTHSTVIYPLQEKSGQEKVVKNDNGGQEKVVKNKKGGRRKGEKKQGAETRSSVLMLIKENPRITRQELEEKLNISSSAIQKHIKILKEQGSLVREGDTRRGYWIVLDAEM